jgi:hypothetical protein
VYAISTPLTVVYRFSAYGLSQTGSGSSFAGQRLNGATEGGLGSLGGRDAQKGQGAKISLQLKF